MLIILPFSERIDGLHFATTRSGFWMQLFLSNFWVNPIHGGCAVFPWKKLSTFNYWLRIVFNIELSGIFARALLDSRCWSVTDVALDHMASVAR